VEYLFYQCKSLVSKSPGTAPVGCHAGMCTADKCEGGDVVAKPSSTVVTHPDRSVALIKNQQ